MNTINPQELERKIYACWLGKNIGGTLGGPHEGKPGPLALEFYDPVPEGVLPNDDLDLQLVWLHHLRTSGAREVTPEILGEAWIKHVQFPYDEYAISLRNAARGLTGATRGQTDNYFGEGMGAAIRSEIWACVAPGQPQRAAGFAWADAVNDHCGEGVWAEVFFSALQSAAFGEKNHDVLLNQALDCLPSGSEIARAVALTRDEWEKSGDWRRVRESVLATFGRPNFTHVTVNVCFTVLGWLAGDGDFGRSICIAVNCGYDTDCTGATLGALMGIIDPEGIPRHWQDPVGDAVVVSPPIVGIAPPRDLAELTRQVMELGEQLRQAHPPVKAVAPCVPASAECALFAQAVTLEHRQHYVEDFSRLAGSHEQPESMVIHGHWVRVSMAQFTGEALDLVVPFFLQESGAYALMAFSESDICCAVDRRQILRIQEDDPRRSICTAPSPHRAGPFLTTVTLSQGSHTLHLRLRRPAAGVVECVFAVADSQTHQWLTDIFNAQTTVSAP